MKAGRWAALGMTVVASCGGEPAAPANPGPDLATPHSTFVGAMRAVEAGDFAHLLPYLTEGAERRLRSDLDAWRSMLLHPREGPRLLARTPTPSGPAAADQVRQALAGEPAPLFRLFVAADPRPFVAPSPSAPAPGARRVEVLYPLPDGSRRSVVLALDGDHWKVDRLNL